MAMFLKFFGKHRKPGTLSQRDWDRFIRARRAGRVGPSGRPVSDRTIEYDLKFLLAVLNWAARSRDEEGRLLLESNPLRGLKTPSRRTRPGCFSPMRSTRPCSRVSLQMDWRFRVALVIAHETGHRIGAIRQLRWSDIDMERRTIRWRAEHEKTGHEHQTPVTAEALDALEEARRRNPGIGDVPLFPAPGDPSKSVSRSRARTWWTKAQTLAGLEPMHRRGWHSLRRKFASDLMNQPLKVALRAGRVEDGPDRPPVLSAGRRGPAPEGPRRPPEDLHSRQLAGINSGNRNPDTPKPQCPRQDSNLGPTA